MDHSRLSQNYTSGRKVDLLMKKLAEYMRDGPFHDGDSADETPVTTIKVETPLPEPKKVKSVPPKKVVEPPRPVSFKPSKQIMQEIQEEAMKN